MNVVTSPAFEVNEGMSKLISAILTAVRYKIVPKTKENTNAVFLKT